MSEDSDPSGGQSHSPLRRSFDVCLVTPIGVAVSVVEEIPELIAEGRRRLELQLGNALFVGRFVVNQKQRELSARLDALLGNAAPQTVEDANGTAEPPPAPPGPERPAPDPAAAAIVAGALADYDTLSASQVVRRLESLGPDGARRRPALRGLHPQSSDNSQPGRSAARRAVERAPGRVGRWSWPGQPVPTTDKPVRGLLSHALVSAEAMRGGAALVGDATTVTLLDHWTQPGDTAHLLVGEYEGVVVGLLAVTASPGPRGLTNGLIECCYVETGARGVGVGTALMDAAVAWCTERGCSGVDALALPGDRTTKQRLEAAGFSARLLTLSRRLD